MTDEKLIAAYVNRKACADVIPVILYRRHFKRLRKFVFKNLMVGWGTKHEAARVAEHAFWGAMKCAVAPVNPLEGLGFAQQLRVLAQRQWGKLYTNDKRRIEYEAMDEFQRRNERLFSYEDKANQKTRLA